MLSTTRSTGVHSPRQAGIRDDTITSPVSNGPAVASNGSPVVTDPDVARVRTSPVTDRETRRARSRRKAHRSRLHAYAILAVALIAFLVALAASNTAYVKVDWVFGSSHVSLVWLVLFAAILGWLLGLVATGTFHWRTRAPRRPLGAGS